MSLDWLTQTPSIESPKTTPSLVEWDLLPMIEKKFSITAEEEQQQLQDTITTLQSSSIWPPEDTKQCITQLLQQYTAESQPGAELLLALNLISKNITNNTDKLTIFKQDSNYVNSLIWNIKSSKKYKILQEQREEQKAVQKEQEASQKEQQINQEASQKEQQAIIKEQQAITKEQQAIQDIKTMYSNAEPSIAKAKQNNALNKNISIQDFNATEVIKDNKKIWIADYLQQILWVDKEAVADYLRYQIYLHNKSEQAKSNPSIVLSIEESASSEQFSSLLRDSGIDSDQFFKNFDTGSNRLARTREQTPETIGKTTLANLSETSNAYTISWLEEAKSRIPNAFDTSERAQEGNLLHHLPYPEKITKADFQPDRLAQTYTAMVTGSTLSDYPLCDTKENSKWSNTNKNARHLSFLYHMVENNPSIDPTSLKKYCDAADITLQDGCDTPDAIRTQAKRYLVPQMESQLKSTNDYIAQETGPRYVDMVQQLLSDTPGLQNFEIKPQEIAIWLDGMKIPYYLPGHKDKSGEITMDKEGNIRMTNLLYDEWTIESNTNIMIGHVNIGKAPTMNWYHNTIVRQLSPDILWQSDEQKIKSLSTLFDTSTESVNQDFEFTKASLAHQLAGTQVAAAWLELMKTFHQTPDTKPSNITDWSIITGPYSDALKAYDYTNDTAENRLINASNHPEAYDIMSLFRNSTLSASDTENARLLQDIDTLQHLITTDKNLYQTIQTTDPSLLTTSDKILLSYCHPERKNLHDLLCLLSNNPDHPSHWSLDHKRIQSLINQLQQLSNGSLNSEAFHLPLQLSQRLSNTIAAAEQNKADKELDNALKRL